MSSASPRIKNKPDTGPPDKTSVETPSGDLDIPELVPVDSTPPVPKEETAESMMLSQPALQSLVALELASEEPNVPTATPINLVIDQQDSPIMGQLEAYSEDVVKVKLMDSPKFPNREEDTHIENPVDSPIVLQEPIDLMKYDAVKPEPEEASINELIDTLITLVECNIAKQDGTTTNQPVEEPREQMAAEDGEAENTMSNLPVVKPMELKKSQAVKTSKSQHSIKSADLLKETSQAEIEKQDMKKKERGPNLPSSHHGESSANKPVLPHLEANHNKLSQNSPTKLAGLPFIVKEELLLKPKKVGAKHPIVKPMKPVVLATKITDYVSNKLLLNQQVSSNLDKKKCDFSQHQSTKRKALPPSPEPPKPLKRKKLGENQSSGNEEVVKKATRVLTPVLGETSQNADNDSLQSNANHAKAKKSTKKLATINHELYDEDATKFNNAPVYPPGLIIRTTGSNSKAAGDSSKDLQAAQNQAKTPVGQKVEPSNTIVTPPPPPPRKITPSKKQREELIKHLENTSMDKRLFWSLVHVYGKKMVKKLNLKAREVWFDFFATTEYNATDNCEGRMQLTLPDGSIQYLGKITWRRRPQDESLQQHTLPEFTSSCALARDERGIPIYIVELANFVQFVEEMNNHIRDLFSLNKNASIRIGPQFFRRIPLKDIRDKMEIVIGYRIRTGVLERCFEGQNYIDALSVRLDRYSVYPCPQMCKVRNLIVYNAGDIEPYLQRFEGENLFLTEVYVKAYNILWFLQRWQKGEMKNLKSLIVTIWSGYSKEEEETLHLNEDWVLFNIPHQAWDSEFRPRNFNNYTVIEEYTTLPENFMDMKNAYDIRRETDRAVASIKFEKKSLVFCVWSPRDLFSDSSSI
ncbi:hypothetical protein GCK72_023316 [Caenorhabditis remanei]|uniref:Uncharacterized protein n=1 Tax=Caenorhabditis remanei TaxID=31234 RepID=A0A6A5FW52_CAERE|nr:hypothetical protein GCK72_023316 [Caenorhabditis remanei]KAF1746858.1 hypothetical protein GCK72_023316 [Caenorhabditis remanei]